MFVIDSYSQTLTLDADYSFEEVEKHLSQSGYTLGYLPAESQQISIKQALSDRVPNLYALKYGELEDLCVALEWQLNSGQFLNTRKIPRQALGANWKNMLIGTEGDLGILYQATLKVFLKEPSKLIFLVSLPSFQASYQLEQQLSRYEMTPLIFRRFTKRELKEIYGSLRGECFLLLEWEGTEKYFNRLRAEWNHRVAAHTDYQVIDKQDLQKTFSKILRREVNEVAWGNLEPLQSSPLLKEMKKRYVKGLNP